MIIEDDSDFDALLIALAAGKRRARFQIKRYRDGGMDPSYWKEKLNKMKELEVKAVKELSARGGWYNRKKDVKGSERE